MIAAYMGTPGSGKSLHSAEDIWVWLKSGKKVIANFPINLDALGKLPATSEFLYLPNEYITPGFLWRQSLQHGDLISRREKQVLLVLDEVGQMFDPRELMVKGSTAGLMKRRAWCQWFPVSRKLRYEVILISQDFKSQVDKQIYAQCEVDVFHRNIKYMGFPFNLIGWIFGGFFIAMYKVRRQRTELHRDFFKYQKRFGRLYDTFNLFLGSDFIGPPEPLEYDFQTLYNYASKGNKDFIKAVI